MAQTFGAESSSRLRDIPLAHIERSPEQPRRRFDPAALDRLAASIRVRGVLQPVLVRTGKRSGFALIAGERRWRAAGLAGLTEIPAFVRDDTDDATALELALTENTAREDLTVVEEARTLSVLLDDLGLTKQALSERVGRSRADVANTVRLLELSDSVLDLLETGTLSKGHGKALLAIADPVERESVATRAAEAQWSVRRLEAAITGRSTRTGEGEPIDDVDDQLERLRTLGRQLEAERAATIRIARRGTKVSLSITSDDIGVVRGVVEDMAHSARST